MNYQYRRIGTVNALAHADQLQDGRACVRDVRKTVPGICEVLDDDKYCGTDQMASGCADGTY